MRSRLSSGTRVQYTQPPNGSLNGAPSTSTSVRLTPLGPMPRSETPCVVGCDDRLLVRRNRLKVGIWRSTSSATTAGEFWMSSAWSTLMLAGVSPSRCSVRDAVTVTCSSSCAGARTICSGRSTSVTRSDFSAKPPARTITVTSRASATSTEKRPSGPVVTRCSAPDSTRMMTAAPETAPPVASWTTPEIDEAAKARTSAAIKASLRGQLFVNRTIIMRGMRVDAALFALILAAPALVVAQGSPIRVHAATVLDGTGRTLRNATVVVQGSKITAVETGTPAGATYNLGQVTILPGMIDVHAHIGWHFDRAGRYAATPGSPAQEILYAAENAWVTLAAGFTTIQSPGAPNDVELREAIARGVLPGPRILTSIRQLNERSGTPDEIRQKVLQLKADGADVIKIFASASIRDGGKQTMTDDQLNAACGEARSIGIRTMVHAHSTESVKATVNA